MMELAWNDDKMGTGIKEIDDQHKEWLSRFNEFNRAVTDKRGKEALSRALFFFLRYTETHFTYEEKQMKQTNCPAEATNRAEHEKFRKRLAEIMDLFGQKGGSMIEAMQLNTELKNWLLDHICTVDVQLRLVAPPM